MSLENRTEIVQDGNGTRGISRRRLLLAALTLWASACAKKAEQAAIIVTATPTALPPEQPTSTPTSEPAIATSTPEPKQEPTTIPRPVEPTPRLELPRFLKETPVYGVYIGEIMTEPGSGGEGVVGESLFSHLPDDRVLVSYGRFKPCPDGSPITPLFLISPNFIRGAGFQHESARTSLVAFLQGQIVIGGELTIKDLDRRGTLCKGNPKLVIGARLLPEQGKDVLLNKLTAMLQKADPRMTLAGVTNIVTTLYGRPLPDIPAQ